MKKILSVLLVLLLTLTFVGVSVDNTVQATYGGLNETKTVTNLFYNNVLDDTNIDVGDVLYGSSYYFNDNDDTVEGTYEYGIGKNLFDIDYFVTNNSNINKLNDNVFTLFGVGGISLTDNVEFKPLTQYTFTGNIEEDIDGKNTRVLIEYTDFSIDNIITPVPDSSSSFSITSDSGKTISKLSYAFSNSGGTTTYTNFMIEEGTVATSYEKYIELDKIGESTDLSDTVFNDTNTTYIGRDFNDILQSAIGWSNYDDNANSYAFSKDLQSVLGYKVATAPLIAKANLTINDDDYIVNNKDVLYASDYQTFALRASNILHLRVLKVDVAIYNSATLEAYLQGNDVEFHYELETPVASDYDLTYVELIGFDRGEFLYNLSDEFGIGNEPTIEEFEALISEAPEHFETYTFNYNNTSSNAVLINAEYNVNNIIENGDFSNGVTGWGLTAISNYSISNGLFTYSPTAKNSSYINYDLSNLINENDIYYFNYDELAYDTTEQVIIGDNAFFTDVLDTHNGDSNLQNFSLLWYRDNINESTVYFRVRTNGNSNWTDITIGNVMLFDFTSYYGLGNEPSIVQFEALVDTSVYADTYTYEDDAYMTVTQDSPLNQYYVDTLDTEHNANFRITLEDSIEGLLEVEPTIIINKYDLDMVYEGLIFEGNITDESDVDADNKLEHNFSYNLPEPTSNEEGYIYVAYDELGGTVLGAGYVFNHTGTSFNTAEPFTEYGDDVFRLSNSAVTIGSSAYSTGDPTEFLFEPDEFSNYLFNSSNPYFLFHYRYFAWSDDDSELAIYSENTDQQINIGLEELYLNYTYDNEYIYDPQGVFDNSDDIISTGFLYFSVDNTLPPLLDFLYNDDSYNYLSQVTNWVDVYNNLCTNLFNDVGYAENKGVYTYFIDNGSYNAFSRVAVGETPIYYLDNFNTFTLIKHLIGVGQPFVVNVDAEDSLLLNDSYDTQYIYDTNTNIFNSDINLQLTTIQEIRLQIFAGLSEEGGNLRYTMTRESNIYKNGMPYDAYDIYIQDAYELRVVKDLEEITDTFLTNTGINDTLGKLIITFAVSIALGALVFFKTKNYIATLIVFFIVLGIAFVLGFIPAWVILLVIMTFSLLAWYVFRNTTI